MRIGEGVAMRILLIAQEQKLAKCLELDLQYHGYEVVIATDDKTGQKLAQDDSFQVILIDGDMPNASGLLTCKRLRTLGLRTPIILLKKADELEDRIEVLDAGANDYILKPVNIPELISRIGVYSPPETQKDPDELRFLDLTLNRRTREVRRGNRVIELTATEYELLEFLLSHPRQVLTREQILEKVWGYDFSGDSNIIEVYIRYLRLKLESNKEKRIIQTVRGVGYVLKE